MKLRLKAGSKCWERYLHICNLGLLHSSARSYKSPKHHEQWYPKATESWIRSTKNICFCQYPTKDCVSVFFQNGSIYNHIHNKSCPTQLTLAKMANNPTCTLFPVCHPLPNTYHLCFPSTPVSDANDNWSISWTQLNFSHPEFRFFLKMLVTSSERKVGNSTQQRFTFQSLGRSNAIECSQNKCCHWIKCWTFYVKHIYFSFFEEGCTLIFKGFYSPKGSAWVRTAVFTTEWSSGRSLERIFTANIHLWHRWDPFALCLTKRINTDNKPLLFLTRGPNDFTMPLLSENSFTAVRDLKYVHLSHFIAGGDKAQTKE